MALRPHILRLAVVLATAGGCADSPAAPEPVSPAPSFLANGTRVAASDTLAALPEPFDPARHRLLASARTDRNLARSPGFAGPSRRRARPPSPAPAAAISTGGDIGLSLWQWTRPWYGLYAAHDAGLGVQLPARTTGQPTIYLFAPTTLPSGWACLETTTLHQRAPNSATAHYQGWFDWCQSGPSGRWIVYEPMDPDFQFRYVRQYQGRATLVIAIVTPNTGNTYGHCWYGTMYDYAQGGWVQVAQSCTTGAGYSPAGQGGWAYWESHDVLGADCPSLAEIAALDLRFADPATGSWISIAAVPPGNVIPSGGGSCWSGSGGPYTFTYPGTSAGLTANSWLARTTVSSRRR